MATKTSTKSTKSTKATKETTPKAKATKAEPKPKGKAEPKEKGISPNQIKVLEALAKSKTELTYNGIREATGIQKGLTKMIAAQSSKGATYPDSLEGRGLVTSHEAQGETRSQWCFGITDAGRKALKEAQAG